MQIKAMKYDVLILGAGAAGLFCAIGAGKRGRTVAVIEHNDVPGRKIRISGGGKCNFTNRIVGPEHFISANPRFPTSALRRYTPSDFIRLVEGYGVRYFEKEAGQLFCSDGSGKILEMLSAECTTANVRVMTGCSIERVEGGSPFHVVTNRGLFTSETLVVATGGCSVPALGASRLGYRLAEQFGLRIIPPVPGLVPLLWSDKDRGRFGGLSGISFTAAAATGKVRFTGGMVFTHRGLSGPAILQTSSYWNPGTEVSLDLLPETDIAGELMSARRSKTTMKKFFSGYLPPRVTSALCGGEMWNSPLCGISSEKLRWVAGCLKEWKFIPAGTEGFEKSEVTCGGVDTRDLSSRTMAARKLPHLYFIGEVVDVTGWLGGYNFQWAWSSGHAAGEFV